MKTTVIRVNAVGLAPTLLAVLALLTVGGAAHAQTPWSTPDASNNIHSTNTGNVGVGTANPVTQVEARGTGSFGGDVLAGSGGLASPFGGLGLVQNLIPNSETIGGTGWNIGNGATAVQNAAAAPDGNVTAAKLICGGINSGSTNYPTGPANGGPYTFSFWAKAGNSARIQYGVYDYTTFTWVTFVTVTDLDSNWRRLVATGTLTAGHTLRVYIYPDTVGGAANNYNYVWGAQVTSSNSAGVYARTAGLTVNAYNGGVIYGNLGVGTATPAYKLDVAGSVNGTGLCIAGDCKSSWAQVSGGTASTVGAVNVSSGQFGANMGGGNFSFPAGVGIGMPTPGAGYKLDVNGDTRVTGAVSTTGAINAGGAITGATINATYQDVAEWVPSTQKLSAGTVVVLDAEKTNHVVASMSAYDTKVAGVISARPGIALGEGGEDKTLVATTGRVKVKVDATRAPIKVGDLLVTSDTEGVAMKSEPIEIGGRKIHAPGTIIGKALEPLASGTGEILVLLSLQ